MKACCRMVVLVIVLIVGGFGLSPSHAQPPPPPQFTPAESPEAAKVAQWLKDEPPASPEANYFSVIGGLSMMQIGRPAMEIIAEQGIAAFYAQPQNVEMAVQSINHQGQTVLPLLRAGGVTHLRDVQNMPWGMIEYAAGQVDYSLSDALVSQAEAHDMVYVGMVLPFAAWDLAGGTPTQSEMCARLLTEDYFYLAQGNVMERYHDLDAFIRWLGLMVERYDGDGLDDMPNLRRGIQDWQIHNEPEGEQCGLFRNDPAAFVELMRRSYETIKASCADCRVLQGGAGFALWLDQEVAGSRFWADYAAAGGAAFVDVIAVHYNDGKIDGGNETHFATQLQRLSALLGEDKPIWVTEFGVFTDIGMPEGSRFMAMSETEAAAWYTRFYTVGLANGVTRFFSDASAFVRLMPAERQVVVTLPYYTNKLLQAKLGGFTAVEMLGEGQYRFMVNDAPVYVLWGGMPTDELQGALLVTDMYGNVTSTGVEFLQPSAANPIIVELGFE